MSADAANLWGFVFGCSLRVLRRRGFVVFGQVTTRRTLWIALSSIYGGIMAFGPIILGEVGLGGANGAGGQHAACPFGWTYADNSCFK